MSYNARRDSRTGTSSIKDYRGVKYAKDKQVARCGNAAPSPFAEAPVRANLPEMCDEQVQVA